MTLRTVGSAYMHAQMPHATHTPALYIAALQGARNTHTHRTPHTQIRALLCEERGWRITELKEAWYERPSEQV